MSTVEIRVPTVGESITEVVVGEWFKENGAQVEQDEEICELESDKTTFEVPSEVAGTLEIVAQTGDTLAIGDLIARINTDGSGGSSSSSSSEPKKEEDSADKSEAKAETSDEPKATGNVVEMRIPAAAESVTEATVGVWLVADGEYVEMDEPVCELESDKASMELPAEASGILRHRAEEGDVLPVGDLVCVIEETDGAPSGSSDETPQASSGSSESSSSSSSSSKETYATGHASPAAAKILAEKGIDPKDVKGTGVDGRITKEDAEKAQKSAAKPAQKSAAPKKSEEKAPEPQGERNERRERMTSLRKTIARRLVSAKNETAMLTTFNEVNMKPIMDIRKKYKDQFKEKHEIGLGFMSFFTAAVCKALQEVQGVNAYLDEEKGEIVYHDYCDVSIAVSSPRGLVVPVIRNAEKLDFAGIEKEIKRLAIRARDGKLTIPEMTGGTFSITNGGIFGSMLSTPILNPPQSAILGMHNIVERAWVENGEVVVRPVMYVALSYDHRIVDGKESVTFLYRIKEYLEDPMRLMLGV
ncbi:MAG: 2-oxoglutarate dehydrogenase complex dihydrolipoyllysine-residue succinyltransferase [Bacteroidota bacterium]